MREADSMRMFENCVGRILFEEREQEMAALHHKVTKLNFECS